MKWLIICTFQALSQTSMRYKCINAILWLRSNHDYLSKSKKNKCSQLRIKIGTIGCDQRPLDLFLEHKSIHTH